MLLYLIRLWRIKSEGLSEVEILGRIFTLSWMRRLWTLQGNIVSSLVRQETDFCFFLCFQFADKAVSLPETRLRFYHISKRDSRYWGLCRGFTLECIRLDCFFTTDPGYDLFMLLD